MAGSELRLGSVEDVLVPAGRREPTVFALRRVPAPEVAVKDEIVVFVVVVVRVGSVAVEFEERQRGRPRRVEAVAVVVFLRPVPKVLQPSRLPGFSIVDENLVSLPDVPHGDDLHRDHPVASDRSGRDLVEVHVQGGRGLSAVPADRRHRRFRPTDLRVRSFFFRVVIALIAVAVAEEPSPAIAAVVDQNGVRQRAEQHRRFVVSEAVVHDELAEGQVAFAFAVALLLLRRRRLALLLLLRRRKLVEEGPIEEVQ
mmetsp:Transcript_2735/g.7529  ORF Transcript_2735/g.7529 Transcript_2735/m.7529 type:complete len:255 (+) Transcript_2735:985-1749(+)